MSESECKCVSVSVSASDCECECVYDSVSECGWVGMCVWGGEGE